MNFVSRIPLPKSLIEVSYHDLNMMFGSCFAESMGNKFIEHKFRTDLNPFGVLYNPESIAMSIGRLLENNAFGTEKLFLHEGLYHSLSHHSSFSDISKEACLQKINERLTFSASNLRKASRLFVTLGTAYVYRLKETGQVVANCHKLPDRLFIRERLSIAQIVKRWEELLSVLFDINQEVVLFFTVSPVRYWQDGAHENQLSKSILLLAVEQLQARFPGRTVYFPAYELMMDELRDYRFYAEDFFHPSDTAIRYIWQRFADTCMNEVTHQLMKEINQIKKALNHKPLNKQSESFKQFITQTLLKMERISAENPYICFKKEMDELRMSSEN
jgi:hypothetical protein